MMIRLLAASVLLLTSSAGAQVRGGSERISVPGSVFVDVNLGGVEQRLRLEPFSLRTPGFGVLEVVESLERPPTEFPVGLPRTVRGRVLGQPNSLVVGSVMSDGFRGQVVLSDRRCFALRPQPGGAGYAVVESDALALGGLGASAPSGVTAASGGTGPLASAVFIAETDHDFFLAHQSDPQSCVDDIELLANLASVPYERDVGVRLWLSRIVVRRRGAPYPSRDTDDILGMDDPAQGMPGRWSDAFPRAVRDLVVLFSGKDLIRAQGGLVFDVRGAAYLAGITQETRQFCVIERLGGDVHAAVNLAHEIGHLWGADHCDEPCNSIMKAGTNLSTPLEFAPFAIGQISARRDLLPETRLGAARVVARTIHEGTIVPGADIRRLGASDDVRLEVASSGRRFDLELELVGCIEPTAGLDVIYEYRVNQGAAAQIDAELQLYDWTTARFEPLDTFRAKSEEFLRRVEAPSAGPYLGTGQNAGVIRVRLEAYDSSVLPSGYTVQLDVLAVRSKP